MIEQIEFELDGDDDWTDEDILRKNRACADLLERQTKTRIRFGGDDNSRFAPLRFPRADGSQGQPLFHSGKFAASIHSGADLNGFWAGSAFIGAAILQWGTVGKGGLFPSIVGRGGGGLTIPIMGGKKIHVPKVDISPREYLRISPVNQQELVRTFLEA